ncbi:myrosinase 1-like [Bacillus rossius redtenbacheri]|uniref:myrosinase 1-like n=1 Tax=Bacillus rossius redtenbacheri TaxID=93214 RepID=UPI002FDCF8B4
MSVVKGVADSFFAFPKDFLFGASTASYQIEGAWNVNGKGESIWDRFTHTHPSWIKDSENADVAADSYHLYKDDIQALTDMKVDFYRFSIAWSRILPKGDTSLINKDGINYYNNLINELLKHKIQPMVTMYHWDLPQPLQELGGWPNPLLVDYFEDFARLLYKNFGDRVKWWVTLNEGAEVAAGYSSPRHYAPGVEAPGVGDYLAAHTLLRAHARAYWLYDSHFRRCQGGNVGITLNSAWVEPLADTEEDHTASERALQFMLGWLAHPIFTEEGDYPLVMKERVAHNSKAEGYSHSRLPTFTADWITALRGSADYFALNHYSTLLATPGDAGGVPSKDHDAGVVMSQDPSWPASASSWLKVVPWGMRKLLNWIAKEYGNPKLIITENGFSDQGQLDDVGRINYHKSYLSEVLKAIYIDKCNIIGYTAWSLLDNFEWTRGYTEKFGLYHVDFSKPSRPRTAKSSSKVYAEIIRTRKIPQGDEQ